MLVEIENLRIAFRSRAERFEAVRGVSFSVGKEKFAIVGESGSGKSLTARSLMQLLPGNAEVSADALRFDGLDLRGASETTLRQIRRRRVGFLLPDPKYSLNPVMTIGQQIAEAWREHKGGSSKAAMQAAIGLLEQVKIRDAAAVALRYPHEVSGGMGQRVMIAMMLAPDPELLIADEPTSALDATVQAEILRLIDDLVSARGMGLILISHDLPLVSHFCDRVAVMYAGRIVEQLDARQLHQAQYPYTQGLLACLPSLRHPRARLPTLQRDDAWRD